MHVMSLRSSGRELRILGTGGLEEEAEADPRLVMLQHTHGTQSSGAFLVSALTTAAATAVLLLLLLLLLSLPYPLQEIMLLTDRVTS